MRFQSIDAGFQPEHATEQGLNSTQTVVSARDAQKLLRMPGAKSIRQGATLIVVDAQGNGGADVLYGGAGHDTMVLNADNIASLSLGLTDRRLARVDGGGGIDTLAIDGESVTLDLSIIANQAAGDLDTGSRIASIERIDLTGSGNNTLILTVGDVLDMAGMNLFNTGNGWSNVTGGALGASVQRHQLVVDGDAGDVVSSLEAAGTWSLVGTVSDGSNLYKVFNATHTATSAQLLINTLVTEALDTTTTPPSAPDLAPEDDSGVSNTDDITAYTTDLNFSGTAEAGATVSLFADIDSDGVIDAGELLGTGVATGGNYSIDTNLALGSHNVRVIATDLAGNSAVSGTTVVDVIAMALGFVINGQAADDLSGYSVSSAGDVNGDGLADLIVGAFDSDPATRNEAGRSYVVFGKADGTAVELSDIDAGSGGFVINGQAADDLSGYSVSSAGDVDGDGLDDLIVGARDASNTGELAGRSYVVFGKADGTAVELLDIDAGSGGFVINGQDLNDRSSISVSSAGDVNGDGLADLIVGAHESDPAAGSAAGRSYVVFGKTDGTAVELSNIDAGVGGFVINGQASLDRSGYSVSSAGDVNGDGLADVIVGARSSDPAAGSSAGRSYVVFGKADGTAVELSDIDAGSGGFVINGQESNEYSGNSVSSAGDVNGDGLADLIVGAYGSDPVTGDEAGRSYVVFGKADGTAVELSDIDAGSGAGEVDPFDAGDAAAGIEVACGLVGDDAQVQRHAVAIDGQRVDAPTAVHPGQTPACQAQGETGDVVGVEHHRVVACAAVQHIGAAVAHQRVVLFATQGNFAGGGAGPAVRIAVTGEVNHQSGITTRSHVAQVHGRAVGLAEHHVAAACIIPRQRVSLIRAHDQVGQAVCVDVSRFGD